MGQWGVYDDEGDNAADVWDELIQLYNKKTTTYEFIAFANKIFQARNRIECLKRTSGQAFLYRVHRDALCFCIRALRSRPSFLFDVEQIDQIEDNVTLPISLVTLALEGIKQARQVIKKEGWTDPIARENALNHEERLLLNSCRIESSL